MAAEKYFVDWTLDKRNIGCQNSFFDPIELQKSSPKNRVSCDWPRCDEREWEEKVG